MTSEVSLSKNAGVPTFGEFRKTKPRKLNKFIKDQGFSQVPRGQGAASGGSHTQHMRDGQKVTFASHNQQLLKKGTAKSIYKRVVQGEASSAAGGDVVAARGPLEAVTSAVVNRPVSPQSQAAAPLVIKEGEQEASISDAVGLTIERPVTAPPVLQTPPPSQPPQEERVSETVERPSTAPSALETQPVSQPPREEVEASADETTENPKKAASQTIQAGAQNRNQKKNAKRKAAKQAAKQNKQPAIHPSFFNERNVAASKPSEPERKPMSAEPQPWEISDVDELACRVLDVRDIYAAVKKTLAGPDSSDRLMRSQLQRLKIKLEFDHRKLCERFQELYREGKAPRDLAVALGLQ